MVCHLAQKYENNLYLVEIKRNRILISNLFQHVKTPNPRSGNRPQQDLARVMGLDRHRTLLRRHDMDSMGRLPQEERDLRRLLPERPHRHMDCHRRIHFRIKHRIGTPHRPCRHRRLGRHGPGPLGDTGLDDPHPGLGIRPLL